MSFKPKILKWVEQSQHCLTTLNELLPDIWVFKSVSENKLPESFTAKQEQQLMLGNDVQEAKHRWLL